MPCHKDKPFVALIDVQHQQSAQSSNKNGYCKNKFSIIEMKDPSTSCSESSKRQYLTTSIPDSSLNNKPTKKDLFEIQSISHSRSNTYSSFFVGSRVVSNPSLHLVNRVDPLFFLLSYFEPECNQSQKWQPWNQLCESKNIHSTIQHIIKNDKSQLRHFFHINDSLALSDDEGNSNDNFILYKFQSDKVLTWLKTKVHNVESTIQKQCKARRQYELSLKEKEQQQDMNSGAFSATFVLSSNNDSESKSDYPTHDDSAKDEERTKSINNIDNPPVAESKESTHTIKLTTNEEKQIIKSSIQIVCEYISPLWQAKLLELLKMNTVEILVSPKSSKSRKDANDASPRNDNNSSHSVSTPTLKTSSPLFQEKQLTESEKLLLYTMGSGGEGGSSTTINQKSDSKDNKRKHQEAKSVGLKKLQKVNTKGMKSLSSFFGPKKTKK